jgi:hypothetical protein
VGSIPAVLFLPNAKTQTGDAAALRYSVTLIEIPEAPLLFRLAIDIGDHVMGMEIPGA